MICFKIRHSLHFIQIWSQIYHFYASLRDYALKISIKIFCKNKIQNLMETVIVGDKHMDA